MKKILLFFVLITIVSCEDGNSGNDLFGPGNGAVGQGGSTARFAQSGDFIYIVDDNNLKTINASDVRNPTFVSDIKVISGLETIYPFGEYLFMGSRSSLQIYDISNPASPEYISDFVHQIACDPVVVMGDYAYVTIRDGQTCSNFEVNELIVLDISDIFDPKEVQSIPHINPRGLGFFKGDLFVTEGNAGLKRYQISMPWKPEMITYYQDIRSNDLIGLEETLIITGSDGIIQYSTDQEGNLIFLSQLN